MIGGIEEVREKLEVNTQTQCLRDSNACEWGYKCIFGHEHGFCNIYQKN